MRQITAKVFPQMIAVLAENRNSDVVNAVG